MDGETIKNHKKKSVAMGIISTAAGIGLVIAATRALRNKNNRKKIATKMTEVKNKVSQAMKTDRKILPKTQ
ncbi:MAG: hypothetical protein WC841_05085 [Candidatus Shapirobacteria bacterium]|jgi:hypothetical protein